MQGDGHDNTTGNKNKMDKKQRITKNMLDAFECLQSSDSVGLMAILNHIRFLYFYQLLRESICTVSS